YFVDNNKIMPSYKLSKAHGRRVFGDLPPMLRDDNGDITAVPKITDTGGRTCWLPDSGIEVKGIGTVNGKPTGSYGSRRSGESPDPIGGMIKDKAIYEHLANVYLYIAGLNVPEPLGVAMLYNIRGPNNEPLAILTRKTKSMIRVFNLKNGEKESVREKASKELDKMHYLGLAHSWYNDDNVNAAGQLVDFEGVRIFDEQDEGKRNTELGCSMNLLMIQKGGLKSLVELINAEEANNRLMPKSALFEEMGFIYFNNSKVRVIPQQLSDIFAGLFTDKDAVSEEAKESIRDPRNKLGQFAKKHLDDSDKGIREKARLLYSRYKKDIKETRKIASSFQEEIDYVKKNFC
ncbi:MAG: hypothetical protein ABIB71_04630, partial [Candidatus Woesearchaeota archaeon]